MLVFFHCSLRYSHLQDVKAYGKVSTLGYPIIADEKRELAVELGMLDAEEKSADGRFMR